MIQVAASEESRAAYLRKEAERAERDKAIVAAGGTLPGGFGHGHTTSGRPKVHSGYAHFDLG